MSRPVLAKNINISHNHTHHLQQYYSSIFLATKISSGSVVAVFTSSCSTKSGKTKPSYYHVYKKTHPQRGKID